MPCVGNDPRAFKSIPSPFVLTVECGRCPKDWAFGGFPPEMPLQKPPVCHHVWVTVESASFPVACGLSAVCGFALADNEEKGQLVKPAQNEQRWWKWVQRKQDHRRFSLLFVILC